MHVKISIAFALATITSVAKCQSFPDEAILPGCGETCLDAVVNEASTFGCDAGSVGCLCAAPNFQNGVRDCASAACAADLFPSVTSYLASVCATAVAGAATPAPATSSVAATSTAAAAAASTVVPTTSSFVDTAAPTSSTSSPVVAQSATSSSIIASSTPLAAGSTTGSTSGSSPSSTQGSSSSTNLAAGILPTASSSQSSSGISAAATSTSASHTSSTASATSTSTSTAAAAPVLSAGAKAGIGIGAAIGAVGAIGVIVACIISRKHKNRQQKAGSRQYDISEPMPGAGRVYANDNHSQGFVPESDLEMKSRRYEDMMPRHVPRNMV